MGFTDSLTPLRYNGRVRRTFGLLILAVGLLAAGCSSGDDVPRPDVSEPAGTATEGLILATGTLDLAAATAFGEPGFHETLLAQASVPPDIGSTTGRRLVLTLRDASRPGQECSRQHPLSGCATVDWSDEPGRPNVTPDGVFDNRLVVELVTGALILFLHEDGELATEPEPFKPG